MRPRDAYYRNETFLKWIRKQPSFLSGQFWRYEETGEVFNDPSHTWGTGGKTRRKQKLNMMKIGNADSNSTLKMKRGDESLVGKKIRKKDWKPGEYVTVEELRDTYFQAVDQSGKWWCWAFSPFPEVMECWEEYEEGK